MPALCNELRQRYRGETISTIYFGGGTPSLLMAEEFSLIFATVREISGNSFDGMEITLEANPDDLSEEYLDSLNKFPFNRISIGIQSFNDNELLFINRRHTAAQAIEAVRRCRQHGFRNISIDLIYGLPHQTLSSWAYNIEQALQLGVEHISAYMLGLEENVPLYKSLQRGEWKEADEDTAKAMYDMLSESLCQWGYEHYEISNFAKAGRRSRHNSSYWKGISYIGLGPGAHSYDAVLRRRSWNAPDVEGYISTYLPDAPAESTESKIRRFLNGCEEEHLTATDLYNEYIMTRLRTLDGLDINELQANFDKDCITHFHKTVKSCPPEWFVLSDSGKRLYIAPAYWFVSDEIIRNLIFLE